MASGFVEQELLTLAKLQERWHTAQEWTTARASGAPYRPEVKEILGIS